MSLVWNVKAPDEVVFRSIPWSGPLAGDEINTQTLTRLSGTVVLSNIVASVDGVTATISGGVAGETAVLKSEIVTLDGRTLEQIITIAVEDPILTAEPTGPSTATKRAVVEMAFEAMTLAGYEFDSEPEEVATLLRQLDALMAEWAMVGRHMGYNAPASFGGSDLGDVLGIPDGAVQAVALELAKRACSAIGKSLQSETLSSHASAMDALNAAFAYIPTKPFARGTPRGSGNSARYPYSRSYLGRI